MEGLPSLRAVSDEQAAVLREHVRSLVLMERTVEDSVEGIDWQAVADLYVTRYVTRLQHLVDEQMWESAEEGVNATKAILMVYTDAREAATAEEVVKRCTNAFIPHHLTLLPPTQRSMSHKAVLTVASTICTTLHNLTLPPTSSDMTAQTSSLHALITYLNWPQWKCCNNNHGGCAINEVCWTAIWPWGSQEDHDHPTCQNATGMVDKLMNGVQDYWRMGRPPR